MRGGLGGPGTQVNKVRIPGLLVGGGLGCPGRGIQFRTKIDCDTVFVRAAVGGGLGGPGTQVPGQADPHHLAQHWRALFRRTSGSI